LHLGKCKEKLPTFSQQNQTTRMHKMTKRETQQRLEWVECRQDELRKGNFSPRALIELRDLQDERDWLSKRLSK
jgi:hypothetical protein